MKRKFLIAAIISFFVAGLAAYGLCSSETTNLGLTKPTKGDRNWGKTVNNNMDLLDSAYGNYKSTADDLPEVYIYSDTFNSTTGRTITLPNEVDAITEYSVTVTPTTRAGAIGDIYVTKTTTNFVVKCSEANTTDTFAAVVYYIGDVSNYGGSIYRRWYVSPDSSITDHGNASTTGSLAWVAAQISTSPAIIEMPGNKNYQIKQGLTLADNISYQPQPGAIIDTDFSIRDGNYEWYQNGATNEYYLQASGGGNPNINMPSTAIEDDSQMTGGAAGSLAAGEWDWNDVNGLGYTTVYVRLSDSTDPDTKSADYVEAGYTLTVNGPMTAGLFQTFSGLGNVDFAKGSNREIILQWWYDGGGDHTSAIQSAIDAIDSTEGDYLFVPSGDYIITDPITLHSNLIIKGTGETSHFDGTGLAAIENLFEFDGAALDDLQMMNLRMTGNRANQSGGTTDQDNAIFLRNTNTLERAKFHNLRIEKFRVGINLKGISTVDSLRSENNEVVNCYFDAISYASIKFENQRWGLIEGNTIELDRTGVGDGTDGMIGIWVLGDLTTPSEHCRVANNSIRNGSGESINIHGALYTSVVGNTIDNPTIGISVESGSSASVKADGRSYTSITGNTISSSSSHGIVLRHDPSNNDIAAGYCTVTGNILSDCNVGIAVGNTGTVTQGPFCNTVSGNAISNPTSHGIQIKEAEDTTVTGDNISGAGTTGIRLSGAGRRNIIAGVNINADGADADGIAITNTTANTLISGVIISNVDRYGIIISDTVDNVRILNSMIIDDQGSPTMNRGVYLVGTPTDIQIAGCTIEGYVDGEFTSLTSPQKWRFGNSNIFEGIGTPEGSVTGSIGDIFLRRNGGAGTTLYVKESGNDTNTGWSSCD